MKQFAALIRGLDQTTKTTQKLALLQQYFQTAPDADKLWCLALFTGRRPKRAITTTQLRDFTQRITALPAWLIEDTYAVVGDLAETIALILPSPQHTDDRPLSDWMDHLAALSKAGEDDKFTALAQAWDGLGQDERFVLNKLITGGFRIGVQSKLVIRALADTLDQDAAELTHKLMGQWSPQTHSWSQVILANDPISNISRPYPFYLCHPKDDQDLGNLADWHFEWKWDGIRAQIIKRQGHVFIWSRGEDLITPQFPDIVARAAALPDGTVLDGEILAHDGTAPLPFAQLQKRLGRKKPSEKTMRDIPCTLYAYDILEQGGSDLRQHPFVARRQALAPLADAAGFAVSPTLHPTTWAEADTLRQSAADHSAEGLMIKHRNGVYHTGRKRGEWWKWKRDPMTIDAVMIYAQAGHGRRANLFTDYTFALWDGDALVPIAKAYSGLTDAEFRKITAWVRKNTLQRFGPVRQVPPHHVFELAFEGIQPSPRHKSGIALRFPRMLRWRTDKPATEANTLADIRQYLP